MLTGMPATLTKARKLRKELSLPEVLLWQQLRQRPGGFKFRRQHPGGPFILDFVCLSARLVIEIDGDVHSIGAMAARDQDRDRWLWDMGYQTLRIAARDVLQNIDGVVKQIVSGCTSRQPLHQPMAGSPPRTGEDLSS